MVEIKYATSAEVKHDWTAHIKSIILESGAKRILEVGGGANPTVPIDFVLQNRLKYTVLDISEEELDKASGGYFKICGDIASPDLRLEGGYDFVFSRMLAEHLRDGEQFHRNVFRILEKGGMAIHFFPTRFAPPFIVNRFLPENIAERLLHILQPGRERHGNLAKFPAYYSWCRGPTSRQIRRFEGLGYIVSEYKGYYGHDAYYGKLPPLRKMHQALSKWLVRNPIPWLTSYAYVNLRK